MGLVAHVVVSQNVFENLEVLGFIDACIFTYFIEIGESAPLTCFMGYVGLSHGVKMILETIVVLGGRLFLGPGQAACPSLYMILVAGLPLPSVAYRCSGIYMSGILLFPIFYELGHPFYPASARFVSACQHAIGGIVAIFFG